MKIEEQVLSREQMAHLKELGVDTSDASMIWYCCDNKWYLQINNELSRGIERIMKYTVDCLVPTYTIGDLIEKLPKEINDYHLDIRFDDVFNHISYYKPNWDLTDYLYEEYVDNTPILDALYKTLCWMAENHKELMIT